MADDPTRFHDYETGTLGTGGFGSQVSYVNRCWHTTNEEFVRWTTDDAPDPTGLAYPGPGTFGVDTTSPAVVESTIT